MADLSKTIKRLREKLILSQTEFAEHIGVSFTTVNRWENGKSEPTYKMRRKIVELCNQHAVKIDEE
jgi:transcriptional regulator with XRE-family HTH domain